MVLKATSGRRGWRLDGGGVSLCVCVHGGYSNSEVDARCDKAVKLVIPSGSLITKCCCMYAVHAILVLFFQPLEASISPSKFRWRGSGLVLLLLVCLLFCGAATLSGVASLVEAYSRVVGDSIVPCGV